MPSHGSELFIEHPSAAGVWRRGVVTAGSHGTVTADFGDLDWFARTPLAVGDPIRVFAVRAGEFSEQRASVTKFVRVVGAGGIGAVAQLTFEPFGLPTPFDRRASDRLPAEGSGINVDFEDEIGCEVVDVGPTGLSLYSHERHVPGAIAELTIRFEGVRFVGRAAVHSAVPLDAGRTRYGLRLLDVRDSALREGIERVRAELQARAAHAWTHA